MNKKGVSLSFNVIIIAILGLLVLAILVFMIARTASDTNKGTACAKKGGMCKESAKDCDNNKLFENQKDEDGNKLCQGDAVCCSLVPIR